MPCVCVLVGIKLFRGTRNSIATPSEWRHLAIALPGMSDEPTGKLFGVPVIIAGIMLVRRSLVGAKPLACRPVPAAAGARGQRLVIIRYVIYAYPPMRATARGQLSP